jgi:short-subunit dehydrogenase
VLLEGRTVLVTGASRGLGTSIAALLATRGAKLVLVARSAEGLERAAATIRSGGGTAVVVPADLSLPDAAERLAEAATAAAGPIDAVVNNAGVECIHRFSEIDPEAIRKVLWLNLELPMRLTRALLPGMLARGHGHVVNISSLAGLATSAHHYVYSASKFGLVGFTRSLRASLRAEGKTVSASVVCPGFVSGEGMFADASRGFGVTAPARLGASTPDQVAWAVLRAIVSDLPEVVVNPAPVRPLLALGALSPRLTEWLSPKFGADEVGKAVVAAGGLTPR